MDRRHLRYLVALAEEGGFTRAANRSGIAQPPFSKQIRDLESEIGTSLVVRTSRGATMTAAGEALVDRAREIERLFVLAAQEAKRIGEGLSGRLRIGFTESSIFHPWVVRTILSFRAKYPEIDLVLEEQLSTVLIDMMSASAIDAAFIRPPAPVGDEWRCRSVATEGMSVAFPDNHRLARDATINLSALRDEIFVFFHRRNRPGMTDSIISACERLGFEARTTQVVPTITSALRLVAAGAGVTIVPASVARMSIEGVRFVELTGTDLKASVLFVNRGAATGIAVMNNFISLLVRSAEV